MPSPEFVQGDTRKALRVTVKDSDGAVVNLTGGSVRLLAQGVNSANKPTSNPGESVYNGVLGVFFTNGSDGVVDFQGLGGLCSIGTRSKETYRYQIKFTDTTSKIAFSAESTFSATKPVGS